MNYDRIICGDAARELRKLPEDAVDLTVFSPPYDGLRDYNGYRLQLHDLGQALYRVTKPGGVVVMVIQDQTVNGLKSLTSFKTVIDWCENIGFGLFECNIYKKNGKDGAWWKKRFRVDHEYMPIFVKGDRPKVFDKEPLKIPCKHAGRTFTGGANRNKDGLTVPSRLMTINSTKCPGTIWDYSNGGDKVKMKRRHPAAFPDKIPYDFIQVFSAPGDVVLDPMCGSGSTLIAAHLLGRHYLGIDISRDYVKLARERIRTRQSNMVEGFKNIPAAPPPPANGKIAAKSGAAAQMKLLEKKRAYARRG